MNDYSLILSYLLHYRFMTPYSLPYCIEWQARVGKDEELHMSTYSTSCFNFSLFYVPPFVPSGARSQPVAPHSNCPCTATAVLALPLILCVRRHGRAAVASLPRDSRSGIGDGPESGDESAHAQLIPVRAGRRASDRVQMGFGARL